MTGAVSALAFVHLFDTLKMMRDVQPRKDKVPSM
jgi:hypothetical protein